MSVSRQYRLTGLHNFGGSYKSYIDVLFTLFILSHSIHKTLVFVRFAQRVSSRWENKPSYLTILPDNFSKSPGKYATELTSKFLKKKLDVVET